MIILLLCSISCLAMANNIQQAINTQKITAEFTSNGIHSGKSVSLSLQNKTSNNQTVLIEPGLELANENTESQDHIIVEQLLVNLKPNEKKIVQLNALCTQKSNRCPSKGSKFSIKENINKKRSELAQLIANTNQGNYTGQQAMWCFIDKDSPNNIEGEDSLAVMQLRHYIGKAHNFKVNPFDKNKYIRPVEIIRDNLSIETEGNYYVRNINPGDTITYALYNNENDTITSIKTDIAMVSQFRKHNVRWHFTAEELNPTQKYYLRIKVNGVVYKEWMYKFLG